MYDDAECSIDRAEPALPLRLAPMSYPSTLSPRPSGFLTPKPRVKRREPSGVFSLFQTAQIQQFKEAFSLVDQDGDGIVSESDLKGIFNSLGVYSLGPPYLSVNREFRVKGSRLHGRLCKLY